MTPIRDVVETLEDQVYKPFLYKTHVLAWQCLDRDLVLQIASTEGAPMLIAIRFQEPIMFMATGKGETCPLTVGFSISNALPPPGDFIWRSASSVISSSLATACVMRVN